MGILMVRLWVDSSVVVRVGDDQASELGMVIPAQFLTVLWKEHRVEFVLARILEYSFENEGPAQVSIVAAHATHDLLHLDTRQPARRTQAHEIAYLFDERLDVVLGHLLKTLREARQERHDVVVG